MKLVGEAAAVRLVYSMSYGPSAALAVRRRMDADRNGRITAAESRAEAARVGRRIAVDLRVEVDGDRVPIEWGIPFVGPATGTLDPSPLTIELQATVPLDPGEHAVSLVDVGLDDVDRTDYGFDASAPAVLVASGEGASPAGTERLVSFLERTGGVTERRVTARFRLPGSATSPWPIAAAGTAVVLVSCAVLLVRRARRRKHGDAASAPRTGR